MTAMPGVRKLLFAAPLLAVAGVFAAASRPEAAAAPLPADTANGAATNESDDLLASNCTYYSNASLMTVVGRFGYDCCNNPIAWGKKTAFKVCGGCFPCVPPPP